MIYSCLYVKMLESSVSSRKRRKGQDVDCVHTNLSDKHLRRYILELAKEPIIFLDQITSWKCLNWTPKSLAKDLFDVRTRFRLCPRITSEKYRFPAKQAVMETECDYVVATISEFYQWLSLDHEKLPNNNPFAQFLQKDYTCYADYKYMKELFVKCPEKHHEVDWSYLGFPERNGEHSALWFGTAESFTPCHYDSYGCNLVAQIYGRKRWLLFPPEQGEFLYPTRIPYEESSVFSQVNVKNPDTTKYPKFQHARAHEICSLRSKDNKTCRDKLWATPSMREEDLSFEESLRLCRKAVVAYYNRNTKRGNEVEETRTKELSVEDFMNAVVSPDVVRIITEKIFDLTKSP
ncbi:HSPB1-associated protein 1-like isoform X2 [Xenia sp. Carnegie-2017]|uniref:HSPB1-associated protein 1-like isoform X2 n=1 Tax=Xenia sp. Carnegie-2017 TaxID=2897299 RepID=UPI001F035B79|nr:HSPB1-associated protein 1-like isoform X2 [Xenia sp. Carnegie-2017]